MLLIEVALWTFAVQPKDTLVLRLHFDWLNSPNLIEMALPSVAELVEISLTMTLDPDR